MLDVLVLNRNLGNVCDALVESLKEKLSVDDRVCVVDAGSKLELRSQFTTIAASDSFTQKFGLRFGRGMNLGLNWRDEHDALNPWVLMLPVDAEIVEWNMNELLSIAESEAELAAIKPLEPESPYRELTSERRMCAAWHLEEGPWLVRGTFIEQQRARNRKGQFFDEDNFRGYLTSLELAFRAYANDYWIGATDLVIISENESLLVDRAELINTEPFDINRRLLLEEGLAWLRSKYSLDDPWAYAQLVHLLYDKFMLEHPELQMWGLEHGYSQN